jgi:hypothetical protein
MEWVAVTAAASATIAALSRVVIFVYALRGTQPEDRPSIIQALARMFCELRTVPAVRGRNQDPSVIDSET